jgi:hypothetical protein
MHRGKLAGLRRLRLHYVLFAASIGLGFIVWRRGAPTGDQPRGDAIVWQGRPEDIERIAFETPNRKITLQKKHDAQGDYFLGSFDRTVAPNEQVSNGDHTDSYVNESGASQHLTQTFVSTEPAQKLAKDLAPLKALRAVGRVPKNKLADFGLDKPGGTATIKFRNAERKLLFGDETLGEKDQFVLEPETNEVFVLLGDVARTLALGDERLPNQELHDWPDTAPMSALLSGKLGTRHLVRGGPKENLYWADSTAATKDETATNWMSKIEHLRSASFDPSPPSGRDMIIRIDYEAHSEKLGYWELWKGPKEGKTQYWVVTERTRMPVRLFNEGEQIERDAASVVK